MIFEDHLLRHRHITALTQLFAKSHQDQAHHVHRISAGKWQACLYEEELLSHSIRRRTRAGAKRLVRVSFSTGKLAAVVEVSRKAACASPNASLGAAMPCIALSGVDHGHDTSMAIVMD